MSEHIGPVHYKMFEKILYTQKMGDALLIDYPEKKNELDTYLEPFPTDTVLDKLVDQDNIHGWLAAAIDLVEARFAYAATVNPEARDILYSEGQKAQDCKTFESASELFLDMNNFLLDGMPCDRAIAAVRQEDGSVHMDQLVDVHSPYWKNPLKINPDDSLDETCSGHDEDDHNHDDQDVLKVIDKKDAPAEFENIKIKEDTIFYDLRESWLQGFVQDTDFTVERLNTTNFKLSK